MEIDVAKPNKQRYKPENVSGSNIHAYVELSLYKKVATHTIISFKTELIKLKLTSLLLNATLLENFHTMHFFLAIYT